MAVETAEPPTTELPNPVIKEDFADAKSVFRKAMADEGLSKPEPQTPVGQETEPQKPATEKPATGLPDDILEPKTEPAKPSEALAAIDAMELPKGASQKSVVSFGELKEKAKTQLSNAELKIRELEDKLSKATSHAEIESLQGKLKTAEERALQIEDQWAKVAFEQSPRFQARFVKAEKDAIESAKSYLEGSEIDPKIIEIAAHTTGKKRLDVLKEAGADAELIAAVGAHLATYDLIQKEKQGALDNWKSEATRWQEEEIKRAEAEQSRRKATEDRIWDSVLTRNATLLPFRQSKDENWTTRASELKTRAKEIFNGNGADMETMADIVQRGVASYAMEETISQLVDRVKTLSEENASLRSSRPGGVITTSAGTVSTGDDSKLSREDLSKKTFNEQLQKARGTA